MPKLQNERREAFANHIVSGAKKGEAYMAAGFASKNIKTARVSAYKLLANKEVRDRIDELQDISNQIKAMGIQNATPMIGEAALKDIRTRAGRIDGYAERRDQLLRVVAERAVKFGATDVAGGRTGYVLRVPKQLGKTVHYVEEVDVAILKELRELEKQIAQETGQWIVREEQVMTAKDLMEHPAFHEVLVIMAGEYYEPVVATAEAGTGNMKAIEAAAVNDASTDSPTPEFAEEEDSDEI